MIKTKGEMKNRTERGQQKWREMRIPGFDEEGEFFLGFSDEDFVFPCFAEREENDEILMSDERPDPPRRTRRKITTKQWGSF